MAWIEFPFLDGQREDVEARLMPQGMLASVRNLRQTKDGRWAKRNRYNALTLTTKTSGSDATVPSNNVLSLGAREHDLLILAGAPSRLYNYHDDRSRVTPYDPDITGLMHSPPVFAAARRTIVNSRVSSSYSQMADGATRNDYTVVASINQSGYLVAAVYSEPDQTFLFEQTLSTAASLANVQACAVGNNILVLWSEGTTIKFDYISAVNQQGINKFSGTPVTAGTMFAAGTLVSLQARANDASNRAIIVFQSGNDDITTQQWSSPWASADVTAAFVSGAPGTLRCNAYADATAAVGWVVWVDETNNAVEFVKTNAAFGSPGSVAAVDNTSAPRGVPIIDGDAATPRAIVAWRVVGAGGESGIRQAYLTTVASAKDDYWGWELVSNFLPDPYGNVTDHYAVATPTRNSGALTRRSLYLLRFNFGELTTTLKQSGIVNARFAESSVHKQDYHAIARPHLHLASGTSEVLFAHVHKLATLGETVSAWRFGTTGFDRGHPTLFGGALYYPAAMAWRWDGVEPCAAVFPEPPEIVSLTANTVGSLTASSTYGFRAVLEREEHDGSITLSAPSEAVTIALTAGQDSVDLKVRGDVTTARWTRIRIYRTLSNGSVYFYDRTIDGGFGWLDEGPSTIASINADTAIEGDGGEIPGSSAPHILYTQVAGQQANTPPEGCRYFARAGARLWQAGLEEANRARCSKKLFTGEAASFPALEEFSITTPETILGIGALDATPVFFGARTITVASGPGPDDAGIGLFETYEIPTDSGLVAWGHRTIVECTHGLVYQAPEGIHLIPRGFGPPEFIGQPVRDTLAAYPYITSAVVNAAAKELRMTAVDDLDSPEAGVMIIWDLRTKAWIVSDVDADNTPLVCATDWRGTHVIGGETLPDGVKVEGTTTLLTDHLESSIETGDIRPGDVSRFGRCRAVQFNGEWRAACNFVMDLSVDSGETWPYTAPYDLNTGYVDGRTVQLRWHLPVQKATHFRLRIRDTEKDAGGGSEGVIYLGLSFDLRQKTGGARLPIAKRR